MAEHAAALAPVEKVQVAATGKEMVAEGKTLERPKIDPHSARALPMLRVLERGPLVGSLIRHCLLVSLAGQPSVPWYPHNQRFHFLLPLRSAAVAVVVAVAQIDSRFSISSPDA